MFNEWKVLHLDQVEAESVLFCRALEQEHFAGQCESVRSFEEGQAHLDRALYTPRAVPRPDIIVINWHPDSDARLLEFVRWVRRQPQLHSTPIIVFVQAQITFAAQERAQNEGVTELIARPGTFEGLLEQVQLLLERCASRCVMR